MTTEEYDKLINEYDKEYFHGPTKSHYDDYTWEKAQEILGMYGDTMLSFFEKEQIKTVLDCGGAKGYLTKILRDRGFDAQGFDISTFAVMETNVPRYFRKDDILDMSYYEDDSFDLVFAAEVLEHIPEEYTLKALHNMFRVAKKYVVFSCPLKEKEEDIFDDGEITHINVHTRQWWEQWFTGMFKYVTEDNLFRGYDTVKWNFFPLEVTKVRTKNLKKTSFDDLINPLDITGGLI